MKARSTSMMIAGVFVLTAVSASAQGLADARKLYDAGQYQQAVAAAQAAADDPRMLYLAGQSQQKLGQRDEARQRYSQLASRPDSDPWHDIGRAAVALLGNDAGGALAAANQAAERDGSIAEAHYQRGLAFSAQQDMANAATAFEKATEIDPNWADAHYYAGLAYSKVKRIDQMASHFNTFLRLAPQSPSRAEVQSIMRTLGGR
ncbi:MAG TPA: tetratricopeptide repeat protein [Vicinamibacterales bacterium]|nr:tetratricopeptide repeat protein [Vicinamibacterales bacterium]